MIKLELTEEEVLMLLNVIHLKIRTTKSIDLKKDYKELGEKIMKDFERDTNFEYTSLICALRGMQ